MQHTYLRYECADAFSLTTSSSSTSTLTTSPLSFLNVKRSTSNTTSSSTTKSTSSSGTILLSTAGSQIIGYNTKTNEPCLKIGHRELLSGGLGTGKALNSNEVLCITTTSLSLSSSSSSSSSTTITTSTSSNYKVATGWKDGSIRIFDLYANDLKMKTMSINDKLGMVHSLLFENDYNNTENEEFIMREPLVLNGHSNSSITCLTFDINDTDNNNDNYMNETTQGSSSTSCSTQLLASGSSDGRIILWDIIAESGLFRLIGHKGPITDLSFATIYPYYDSNHASMKNGVGSTTSIGGGGATKSKDVVLISSSLDGLVKIWNMDSQCCVQSIANHNGQVTCSSLLSVYHHDNNDDNKGTTQHTDYNDISCRSRLITGCIDGKVRVWSVHSSKRMMMEAHTNDNSNNDMTHTGAIAIATTTASITTAQSTSSNNDINNKMIVAATNVNNSYITDDQDDICTYMGTLPLPPNSLSNEKIQSVQSISLGQVTYIGVLRNNSKYVDIYLVRSLNETLKKRMRRLRRKREKESLKQQKKEQNNDPESGAAVGGGRGKKRGILDDDDSEEENDTKMKGGNNVGGEKEYMNDDQIKATDEFEYITTVRSSNKIKAFSFSPQKEKKGGIRIVLALATNALETHSFTVSKVEKNVTVYDTNLVSTMDMYGHPTGIRSIALSSDDTLSCTVSKNMAKVWNVNNRSCLRSLPLRSSVFSVKSKKTSFYGLCVTFLPGDTHFVIGTREGHLLIVDIASGEIVYLEENAHEKEIWSIDLKKPKQVGNFQNEENDEDGAITIMTGSADKSVKFWEIESQSQDSCSDEDESADNNVDDLRTNPFVNHPMLVHVRTLQTTDDVVACRYSYDPTKRLVFVSTLDSQIKVFFDDTLKFFLSLYGHSLPALALDASDDDVLLASGGADKSIKIWGLDFGDTHRTLYGHSDSITDLKFVKKTHNFFTCSKDSTVRYWDGDRFEQILLLNGHSSEINCLALSKSGAFVLSGGMDRQVRVWERTKDMVFLEEEKERALEATFDKIDGKDEKGTEEVLRGGANAEEDEDGDDNNDDTPQSEAAVKRSVLSVSSGDRIIEALELADKEMKEIAAFNDFQMTNNKEDRKERKPNFMLMGKDPASYVLWILRSIKISELEQSLLILSLSHVERLLYYLILLLRKGQGVELCSKAAVFLIKSHQNQMIYGGSGYSQQKNTSMPILLRELRRLLKLRLSEERDTIGYNIAAMRMIIRVAKERKDRYYIPDENNGQVDVWKDLALGR